MTTKGIQGHISPLLCQNFSSTFLYGPTLMQICMNAKIMKTQFFHKIIYDLKCHSYVREKFRIFFSLRPSDLFSILTYVLMDNFVLVSYIFYRKRQKTYKSFFFDRWEEFWKENWLVFKYNKVKDLVLNIKSFSITMIKSYLYFIT